MKSCLKKQFYLSQSCQPPSDLGCVLNKRHRIDVTLAWTLPRLPKSMPNVEVLIHSHIKQVTRTRFSWTRAEDLTMLEFYCMSKTEGLHERDVETMESSIPTIHIQKPLQTQCFKICERNMLSHLETDGTLKSPEELNTRTASLRIKIVNKLNLYSLHPLPRLSDKVSFGSLKEDVNAEKVL